MRHFWIRTRHLANSSEIHLSIQKLSLYWLVTGARQMMCIRKQRTIIDEGWYTHPLSSTDAIHHFYCKLTLQQTAHLKVKRNFVLVDAVASQMNALFTDQQIRKIAIPKFQNYHLWTHWTYFTTKCASVQLNIYYNMVGSALSLQRALYSVHCTNTMHSRMPSFAITPTVLVSTVNRYFCNIRSNKIRHISLIKFIWLPLI